MINYSLTLERPSTDEFLCLRSQVGWAEIHVNLAKQSLENSLFHVTIRKKSQLIAMARVVGDGAMYFYIQDVIVAPKYQNLGLGTVLMKHVEDYLAQYAQQGATISLLAAKGKEEFYSRYHYIARPNNALGNGMCKFV